MGRILVFCCRLLLVTLLAVSISARMANATPKLIRVTLLVPASEENPFWSEFSAFSQAAADQLGIDLNISYNSVNQSRFSYGKLLDKELLNSPKPDYLMHIFLRNHSEIYLQKSHAAGVKSFIINTATPQSELGIGLPREKFPLWIGHSYPDDEKAGRDLANCLINHTRSAKGEDHQVRMLATLGAFDSTAGNLRYQGLKSATYGSDVNLLQAFEAGWDGQKVYRKIPQLLQRHGYPDAIWNASDLMAISAQKSLHDSGLLPDAPIMIGGMDWTKSGLEAIRDGRIHASLGGHFMEGGWALVKLFDYHHGIDFAEDGGATSKLELSLITPNNIGQYPALLGDRDWRRIDFHAYSKFKNPALTAYRFAVPNFLADLR